MAGSRLDKIGTIFSRTTGLLKSGAMKYPYRPVWYDVYRVFPPKFEPHIDREPSISVEQVPNILYKEDKVRARFFKKFGLNPDGKARRLGDAAYEDPSSTFVEKYNQVQASHPDWSFDQVFDTVGKEYEASRPQIQIHRDEKKQRGQRLEGTAADSQQNRSQSRQASDDNLDEDINSVSSELLGRSDTDGEVRPKKMPLVTAESLRALFEEAKSNQNSNPTQSERKGGKSEEK